MINSDYSFKINYKESNGRLIGIGTILKGGNALFEVKINVAIKGSQEQTMQVYQEKMVQLIEGFRIGEKVSSLKVKEGKILRQKLGESKEARPFEWKAYQQQISHRIKEKHEIFEEFKKQYPADTEVGKIVHSLSNQSKTRELTHALKELKEKGIQPAIQHALDKINNQTFALVDVLESLLRNQQKLSIDVFCKQQLKQKEALSVDQTVVPPPGPLNAQVKKITVDSTNSLPAAARTEKAAKKMIGEISKAFSKKFHPIREFFHKYFIDGDAQWKQQKYALAMNGIVEAFEKVKGDGERLYTGGKNIADLYKELSQSSNLLDAKTKDILGLLVNASGIKDNRKRNRQFIDQLRKALESPEYQQQLSDAIKAKRTGQEYQLSESAQILLDIAQFRFNGVDMHTFLDDLVHGMIHAGEMRLPAKETQQKKQENIPIPPEQFESIHAAPPHLKSPITHTMVDKIRGNFNFNFDPHYKSNVPYVNFDVTTNGKERRCLRFGTPTEQTTPWSTKINAEFQSFCMAYTLLGKKHVYVSLQKAKDSGFLARNTASFGSEKKRNEALKELAKTYPEALTVLIFDQDSKFYNQKESYAKMDNADDFMKTFQNQLFGNDPNSWYFIPDTLKDNTSFTTEAKEIMSKLHKSIFEEKETLTVDERKDFIELYYTTLELLVLRHMDPNTFNLSCKDAIDRGGKSNALLFDFLLIVVGKQNDENYQRMLETITHAPSMIVKRQVIISRHERRKRLTDAVQRLHSSLKKEGALEALKKINKEYLKVNPEKFPLPPPRREEQAITE